MTIEQTVEIPTDHILVLEVPIPQDIPAGKARLELSITAGGEESDAGRFNDKLVDLTAYLSANSPRTIEEAVREAEKKAADPNRKPFQGLGGSLKDSPRFGGSGVEIQRQMRSEWDRAWDKNG
jgi:hypothetical protein